MSDDDEAAGPADGDGSDGGDQAPAPITPSLVLRAYSVGLFPMAESASDPTLMWVDPDERGVIPLDDRFRVSRSLRKALRGTPFAFTTDTAFADVIGACAAPAPDRRTTWINGPIRQIFQTLHENGFAHSVECWDRSDGAPVLIGGLYGVSLGGAFFGESMFSRRTNASKMCLVKLVDCLRRGGFTLLDAQFITEHLRQFGAEEIPRAAYQRRLANALGQSGVWPPPGALGDDGRPSD